MKPHRRRWVAFSVRGVLLLVLVVALGLGWLAHKARQQREAVAAVEKCGGFVHFDYEFDAVPVKLSVGNLLWDTGWGSWATGREPARPRWVRRAIGEEYFREIAQVNLFADHASRFGPADEALAKLITQAGLRTLQIGSEQVNDANIAYIGSMTNLEELVIFPGFQVSDSGVAHLVGLKKLKVLALTNTRMTDEGLKLLGGLTNLEILVIDGRGFSDKGLSSLGGLTNLRILSLGQDEPAITDAGLTALENLKGLEFLDLSGCGLTDRGIEKLAHLRNLKDIYLLETAVTDEGRRRLQAAIPGLRIH